MAFCSKINLTGCRNRFLLTLSKTKTKETNKTALDDHEGNMSVILSNKNSTGKQVYNETYKDIRTETQWEWTHWSSLSSEASYVNAIVVCVNPASTHQAHHCVKWLGFSDCCFRRCLI